MHIAAHLESPTVPRSNRRYAPRRVLRLGTQLHESDARVVIQDLSATGLLIETGDGLAVEDRLLVELPRYGPAAATVVWQDGRLFGCKFDAAIPSAAISAAVLLSPPGDQQVQAEPGPDQSATPLAPRTRLLLIAGISVLLWAAIAAAVFLFS